MDQVNTLRRYGLFDARVPRYTSFPPANRFEPGTGARMQREWLGALPAAEPVSVYVHVPFCRRLCWFCACRTQGTQTLKPVVHYVANLITEIRTVAGAHLPGNMQMRRLHLGGGTPTLLSVDLMTHVLESIDDAFGRTEDFEFSVEIDPTEAAPDIITLLGKRGMRRASVGVQDFDRRVQKAIGREQGFDITQDVIANLRQGGVESLNVDVLYGLPFQTAQSLTKTLDRVVSLRPDRLALYGYAHVPHVAKRQVMIPQDALPDAEQRFVMAEIARERLTALGYIPLGIDHFALPQDSLTAAAQAGVRCGRNFQGYTDDPCATLIGFGASAISRFPQGYLHNAVPTSAYAQRIDASGLAAHKGYASDARGSPDCRADRRHHVLWHAVGFGTGCPLSRNSPATSFGCAADLLQAFPDLLEAQPDTLRIRDGFMAAARLIAAHIDKTLQAQHIHSLAV